jgi:predicted O-methyltransferase YrrM
MSKMAQKISLVLNRLELEAKQKGNPYWIISKETGKFLNRLIRERNIKKVLEVGTSIGYSSIWIAEALKYTKGILYTIESHEGRYKKAKENFIQTGLNDYIIQLKGHAPDVNIPDIFDMLFLDATKQEYPSYLTSFLFHMKKGGIIIADNALSHREQLEAYKNYLQNSPYLKTRLYNIGTGIYISEIC